jgi:hypothetical protein
MGLPYAPLPVEEEDGLRWVFPTVRRSWPGEAGRVTLERQTGVALDSAAQLEAWSAPQRADAVGRIGISCDYGYIDARVKTANRDG